MNRDEHMPENFFVKVSQPREKRITVLEASQQTLESVKLYFHLMTLREQKAKKLDHLKSQVKSIVALFSDLEEKLPNKNLLQSIDVSLKEEEEKNKKATISKKKSSKKSSKDPHEKQESELDKLNDSLAAIEERLKDLDKS